MENRTDQEPTVLILLINYLSLIATVYYYLILNYLYHKTSLYFVSHKFYLYKLSHILILLCIHSSYDHVVLLPYIYEVSLILNRLSSTIDGNVELVHSQYSCIPTSQVSTVLCVRQNY